MACSVACSGGPDPPPASPQPATVVIAVSGARLLPHIGGTEPEGVFVEVRYVLANGSGEDIRVSQDDFSMTTPDGATLRSSESGLAAWAKSPGGYELTETALLRPGGAPRPWVSIFDAPADGADGPWSFRFRDEPPVEVPGPSDP